MAKIDVDYGEFTNGMKFAKLGTGKKTLLLFLGGPGNTIPKGFILNLSIKPLLPLSNSYTIYLLSRKSNLPEGYTTEDMAKDCAEVIQQDFNGHVDVIIGGSYGGIIMQYFAALYPELATKHVILAAAHSVSEIGKKIDFQFAEHVSQGNYGKAGATIAKGVYNPGFKQKLMSVFFRLMGSTMLKGGSPTFKQDIMVEAHAEVNHDGREILKQINVPILLLNGDEDIYFPKSYMEETAALIKDCRLELISGKGHTAFESPEGVKILQEYLETK